MINIDTVQEALKKIQNATAPQSLQTPYVVLHKIEGMNVPAFVLGSAQEMRDLGNNLGELAKRGIIIHTHSTLYRRLTQDLTRQGARQMIKPYTAHNDKLGFNWDVLGKKYVPITQINQFKNSSYPSLIRQAIEYLNKDSETYGAYVSHLNKVLEGDWTKEPVLNRDRQLFQGNSADQQIFEGSSAREVGAEPVVSGIQQNFKKLPSYLSELLKDMQTEPEMQYAQSLINPFSTTASGVRVPMLNPVETVTHYDYQSVEFKPNSSAFVLIQYDALRSSPYLVIVDPLSQFTSSPAADRPIVDQDPIVAGQDVVDTYKRVGWSSGLTWAQFQAQSRIGRGIASQNNFENFRLVSAGFRLIKTSVADNESGVVRAGYFPRGVRIIKNLKEAVEDVGNTKFYCKSYVAKDDFQCGGRVGVLTQGTYRPQTMDEAEGFTNAQNVFLDELDYDPYGAANAEVADQEALSLFGPTALRARAAAAGTQYFKIADTSLAAQPVTQAFDVGIDSAYLGRPHVTVLLLENTTTTSFELEIIRRFEGVPTDQGQSLERKAVMLSEMYSSPLDIIRRIDLTNGLRAPLSRRLDEEEAYIRGFWTMPLMIGKKLLSMLGGSLVDGLLSDDKKQIDPAEIARQASDNLMKLLLQKIPALEQTKNQLSQQYQKTTEPKFKVAGHRLPPFEEEKSQYDSSDESKY